MLVFNPAARKHILKSQEPLLDMLQAMLQAAMHQYVSAAIVRVPGSSAR
jgi:hypothetical protein